VVRVVSELGVLGVGLLMFAENVFPPLPSEVIMPLAGYLSTRGQMSFWGAVAAGSVGSLAGAAFWYWVGRRLTYGQLRGWIAEHGAWLAMTPQDVDRAVEWFGKHGQRSVLFGRLVPVVRTLISVPAGFSRMPFPEFLLASAAGTAIWTFALTYAGRFLGREFERVEQFIGPVSWVVIAVAVAWYLYRVIRIRMQRDRREAASRR